MYSIMLHALLHNSNYSTNRHGQTTAARLFNLAHRTSSEPTHCLFRAMPTFPPIDAHSKGEVYYALLQIFAFPFEIRTLL